MLPELNLKQWKEFAMAIVLFDTLKFAKRLREAGVPPPQAEAEAEILSEVFAVNLQELATKQDLHAVKTELQHEIKEVRGEIKEVRGEIEKLELRLTIKLTVIMATLLSATAALSKFLILN